MDRDKVVKIAFLTSGGDAPGMNAAIRAIVRMSLYRGAQPYAIQEGFRGLIQGGEMIRAMDWNSVAHIIGEGGTIIKSSRCPEFIDREYRKVATLNLVRAGIDKLIVIGGDGSLTGADILRDEWPSLLKDLVAKGAIDAELSTRYQDLMVVGLVGSIDNDMAGTEITIGANSSLHRIIEAVDCIHSTASSHQRAFVIEVMGRHCGWLALNAAISAAADYLLVPEDPPEDGWEEEMCCSLQRHRDLGRSVTIVIIAEGAVDRHNQPIKSEYVRSVLIQSGLDARVTTLGHIQRGGAPSAYDRYLGTMQGIKGVEAVLDSDPRSTPSLLVGINENRMTCRPLVDCIAKTRAIGKAMQELRFQDAFNLRDPDFRANYKIWKLMLKGADGYSSLPHSNASRGPSEITKKLSLGIINCGAPSGGMNAAVAAACLYAMSRGHRVVAIFNGFEGLLQNEIRDMTLKDLFGLVAKGGSFLGTNRVLPSLNIKRVAEIFQQNHLDALLIIGGFEAFLSLSQLSSARIPKTKTKVTDAERIFQAFDIPMVLIPATISNNVPGTEYSIGCDTAMNVILQSCDYIKQSATSSRKRVFVVDVHGGYCGYLATMACLTAGATRAYTHEEGVCLEDFKRDAAHLCDRFMDDKRQGRLIIRNEFCNDIYPAELISKILEAEGGGSYDARWVVLGHLQQGGPPSPLDRIRAIRLAVSSVKYMESLLWPDDSSPTATSLAPGIESLNYVGQVNCDDNNGSEEEMTLSLDEDEDEAKDKNGNGNGNEDEDEDGEKRKSSMMIMTTSPQDYHAMVIGIKGSKVKFTPSNQLLTFHTNVKLRRPSDQWWTQFFKYNRILAKYHHRQ